MKAYISNLIMIGAAALLTACSSRDLFDENGIENNTKASYAENFVKKYANVNMNQSWDYSHKQGYFTLGGLSDKIRKAITRAGEETITKGDWYEVDNNTLTWMQETLEEGEVNSSLGKAFVMSVPNNDFTLVPIFQGVAGAVWNLHVVVDGVDYKIWEKSEDIEVKDDGNVSKGEWYPIKGIRTYEWGPDGVWWDALENTIGDRYDEYWTDGRDNSQRTKVNVTATRAKEIKFSGLPVGAEMYFYLEVTKSGNDDKKIYQNVGDRMSSIDHQMLALTDVPRPANIPAEDEALIIGCEDANLANSDWDYNDVVFLVYGKKIPKPIEITEGQVVKEAITVRYMIEDLGSTDDFDFNDIVLDVSNVKEKTAIYTNGKLTGWNEGAEYQEAVIRHLGGTLPFKLTVGDTEFEEHAGVLGANPNEKYIISGWDMNSHNVSVMVRQSVNSEVYNNLRFPKAGEAPMIIAVDPSQEWMNERQSVPESWFYVPEE